MISTNADLWVCPTCGSLSVSPVGTFGTVLIMRCIQGHVWKIRLSESYNSANLDP